MKGSCIHFRQLCHNNSWAPGPRDVWISKKSDFSVVFAGQKHISHFGRATIDRFSTVSTNIYRNKNITVNGVEQQKPNNFKNWETD